MIATTEALADAVSAAQSAGAIGIDTEFVWERTYYPILGLVQLGYPDGHSELIDAPEIKDWSPLKELIEDKKTVKILHDAQQDLIILKKACGACPKTIFDTQRASGFIGLSSTISLSQLLRTLLDVRLSKSETRSDWLARPLSSSQINYAKDDVCYSTRLMQEIMNRAEALDRSRWIEEEMLYYENEAIYQEFDPETEMPRVRGSGALTHQQRNVLRALGSWREKVARKRNLPRSFVLSDDGIVALLANLPDSAESIKPCRGLTEKTLKYNRSKIWAAIERGIKGDLPDISGSTEKQHRPVADEGYESRVDLALGLIKGVCQSAQLDPALIGNRADITAFVIKAQSNEVSDHPIMNGWQREFIGNELLDVLQGKRAIQINSETKLPELAKSYNYSLS